MAINRAPWNALVDDDGSNLTGSVWNKAAIATTLLDPIDQLVGPVQTWTPTDQVRGLKAHGNALVFTPRSRP